MGGILVWCLGCEATEDDQKCDSLDQHKHRARVTPVYNIAQSSFIIAHASMLCVPGMPSDASLNTMFPKAPHGTLHL
ncbi:hypothetical protein AB1N83_012200 [Pleurotus pulmonarius]